MSELKQGFECEIFAFRELITLRFGLSKGNLRPTIIHPMLCNELAGTYKTLLVRKQTLWKHSQEDFFRIPLGNFLL